MMTYEQFKTRHAVLQGAVNAAGTALKPFPRNAIGLTPDHIKFSLEYRALKAEYDRAFNALRSFNGQHTARFKREIKADIHAARVARLTEKESTHGQV